MNAQYLFNCSPIDKLKCPLQHLFFTVIKHTGIFLPTCAGISVE